MVELWWRDSVRYKYSTQIRREGDDENVIFSGGGSDCSGVATEHDLCKNIGDIDACTDFEMVEVKVPIIFLGTVGFSVRVTDVRVLSFCKSLSRQEAYCISQGENGRFWQISTTFCSHLRVQSNSEYIGKA